MIYQYQKISTPYTTIQMALPYEVDGENQCTELCTLDDVTYVAVPAGVTLPEQPPEITVLPVDMAPTQVQRDAVAEFQRSEAFMP